MPAEDYTGDGMAEHDAFHGGLHLAQVIYEAGSSAPHQIVEKNYLGVPMFTGSDTDDPELLAFPQRYLLDSETTYRCAQGSATETDCKATAQQQRKVTEWQAFDYNGVAKEGVSIAWLPVKEVLYYDDGADKKRVLKTTKGYQILADADNYRIRDKVQRTWDWMDEEWQPVSLVVNNWSPDDLRQLVLPP